jgi:hypothetical protein
MTLATAAQHTGQQCGSEMAGRLHLARQEVTGNEQG